MYYKFSVILCFNVKSIIKYLICKITPENTGRTLKQLCLCTSLMTLCFQTVADVDIWEPKASLGWGALQNCSANTLPSSQSITTRQGVRQHDFKLQQFLSCHQVL